MIDALRFVRNAVARKPLVPELTHVRIQNNFLTAYNGTLAMGSPIELDLEAAPHAAQFFCAVNACEDAVSITLTERGKLKVASGKFRTFIDSMDPSKLPTVQLAGTRVELKVPIVEALSRITPFIGDDASRPFACGVLFRGESLFATNNISLIEHWVGVDLPEVNVPADAIAEVVAHKEEPNHLLISDTRITFVYESGRWISSALSTLEWPNVYAVLDVPSDPQPVPAGFFDAVERLSRFGDELGRCYFHGTHLSTVPNSAEAGASIDIAGVPDKGCYNVKQLLSLRHVAERVDFSRYPQPCCFFGDNLRGSIVGLRPMSS